MFPVSSRRLAMMCGGSASVISEWLPRYGKEPVARDAVLRKLLDKHGHVGPLYEREFTQGGRKRHLFSRAVCMAVLEYYAFEAPRPMGDAADNFRRMAAGENPIVRRSHPSARSKVPKGVVYFVRCQSTGLIKVGFTTDLKSRLNGLQLASSSELEVVATVAGTKYEERDAHLLFGDKRIRGEWFRLSDEDIGRFCQSA